MGAHLTELSRMAANDEDVAVQLASEIALDPKLERRANIAAMDEWMKDQAELYITENGQTVDDGELDRLADEIGF